VCEKFCKSNSRACKTCPGSYPWARYSLMVNSCKSMAKDIHIYCCILTLDTDIAISSKGQRSCIYSPIEIHNKLE
jgi:hypothetical protein